MRTVGQILKEARQKKGFSLQQVEKATKIRQRYLLAIEQDDFVNMPDMPYIQGFIKNYGDFLGLSSYTMLALFRRQFKKLSHQNQKIVQEPIKPSVWQITPNKAIVMFLILLVIGLFSYFFMQYQALHQPPPLRLIHPAQDLVVKEEVIAIYGNTDKDATLTINGEAVLVKEDGKFYKDISLTVIGIQVVYILMEFKKILEKVNKMLNDAGSVTAGISRSFSGMTGLLEGLKTGLSLVSLFGKKKKTDSS